ncbi:MAG TPA: PQQ-binding-like beta-propeller repeat protein [Gammaproteobacteria bacterium]|nr:PQQ-binding-like beta-propeller repeat protein [Gammaproteobacteria bacterium]
MRLAGSIARLLVAGAASLLATASEPLAPPPVAQTFSDPPAAIAATRAGDWPSYNRDLAGTRYSPLAQITVVNVGDIRQAWVYPLGRNTTTGSLWGGSELTPLVVDGVMYATAADRVVALRAESGEELWRYPLEQGAPSRRGLAYRPGDAQNASRIYFTAGRRLIALDASTGKKVATFGAAGEIEMPVVYNGAPALFEDLLIVGANSAPGSVRAFDARTGAQVWTFEAVPRRGELGYDTWNGAPSRDRSSVLHWSFSFTIDADRGLLYAVFDSPGPDDHYGGNRVGDNLFGDSIVALDARTGERRWHFQTVHHDLWDHDPPAPPGLLDATVGGAPVPILAQAGKTGYVYVLNRVTGEPVFGIEERPAPPSDVPGEHPAPTQPIPLKPPPLARVSYAAADLVGAEDTTEEHARFCRGLRDRSGGLQNSGAFTPYRFRAPGAAARTTIVFPGTLGGAGWGGTAADPELGLLFVNTMDAGSLGWIEPSQADAAAAPPGDEASGEGPAYRRMSAVGGPLARFWWHDAAADSGGNELDAGERAWPCQKPPWGQLHAVSASTGEIVWSVPLGITEQLPESKRHTGRLNSGGPIATAGGLVFIGASNDRRFRAFDSRSGEELWSAILPLSAHSVPITYLGADSRQYVAIVAAGAAAIDDPEPDTAQSLIAYALP